MPRDARARPVRPRPRLPRPLSAPTHTDRPRPGRRAVRAAALAAACGALACARAAAQDGGVDLEPPLIEHEALPEAEAAERQSFAAQVVDDRELASVRLYWRYAGETGFESEAMRRVSSSSTWVADVPTPPEETRAIEYWIEARDAGGNRTVRGFAFSPLVRRIARPAGSVAGGDGGTSGPARPRESRRGVPTGGAPEPATEARGGRTALWVVLGAVGLALVVGLAASGGGGGGGGGGGSPDPVGGCDADGCDVTITFDPPVTP